MRIATSLLSPAVLVLCLAACSPGPEAAPAETAAETPMEMAPATDEAASPSDAQAGQTPQKRRAARGPQTLAGMQAQRAQRFDRLDANADGVLTASEIEAAARQGGRGGRALLRADADGDGSVTREEFRDATVEAFNRQDANGDGTITADERPRRRGGAQADPEA